MKNRNIDKDTFRYDLNHLKRLEDFRDFVYIAQRRNDKIKINVKTEHYSMFFNEWSSSKTKEILDSETLLEVLDCLIEKQESKIEQLLGVKDE